MGLGASLFLIAGGAILVWGVNREVAGLDVDAIGVILMVIGIISAVLSLMFWSSWGGFGGRNAAIGGDRRAAVQREKGGGPGQHSGNRQGCASRHGFPPVIAK